MDTIRKIWAVALIFFGLGAIVGGGGCVLTTAQGVLSTNEGLLWGFFALIGVLVFWGGAVMLRAGLRRLRKGGPAAGSHDS